MLRIVLFTSLLLIVPQHGWSQNVEKYAAHISKAWQFYQAGKYKKSAKHFEKAIDQFDSSASALDLYNTACAHALAHESDAAFQHLFYLAIGSYRYEDVKQLTTDRDLTSLHADPRWTALVNQVRSNQEDDEKFYNKQLVTELDSIYTKDQRLRQTARDVEQQYGRKSTAYKNLWHSIHLADSMNLIQVRNILDHHGWLGLDSIGNRGNSTLFLVIQHVDLATQEAYLPMMREAVQKGHARSQSLALLEDRVAIRTGKRQIYGSQIGQDPLTGEYYVLPLIDPEHVNDRRAEVGLNPIEDYLTYWNLMWDLDKHIEQTRTSESSNNLKP